MANQRAVIFLNGDLSDVSAVKPYMAGALLIGCDGGTEHLLSLGCTPDAVVGDFDSFALPAKRGGKTKYLRYPADKDVTDAELALGYAAEQGCREVIIAGVLGTRLDHVLGNILLLTKRKFARLNVTIVEGRQTMYLIRTRARIRGKKGDVISFIPIRGTARASSRGLKYDLSQYRLSLQGNTGISNVLTGSTAQVVMQRGVLLAVHQHR